MRPAESQDSENLIPGEIPNKFNEVERGSQRRAQGLVDRRGPAPGAGGVEAGGEHQPPGVPDQVREDLFHHPRRGQAPAAPVVVIDPGQGDGVGRAGPVVVVDVDDISPPAGGLLLGMDLNRRHRSMVLLYNP